MTTQTQAQTAAQLGITVRELWTLSSNPQFPARASGSNQSVLWNTSDITTFAVKWNAAKANGWKLPSAILATANFTAMAAAGPGSRYTALPGSDPLFDL